MKPFISISSPPLRDGVPLRRTHSLAFHWLEGQRTRKAALKATLTWAFNWYPVRDLNPCYHLERATEAFRPEPMNAKR